MSVMEVEISGESAESTPPAPGATAPLREIRHEYTRSLPPLLSQLGVSLLVSTYQAGKAAAVGVAAGELTLSNHNFEHAMGIASWPGPVRSCGWSTRPSAACALDGRHSFVPRWRPPFLTTLAAEEAVADGAPRYVTALAETDTPQGWPADKVHSGCLIDVASGQTVARGFAIPHSLSPAPQMVLDINPTGASSDPSQMMAVGSTVYFVADDGAHGRELWKATGPRLEPSWSRTSTPAAPAMTPAT